MSSEIFWMKFCEWNFSSEIFEWNFLSEKGTYLKPDSSTCDYSNSDGSKGDRSDSSNSDSSDGTKSDNSYSDSSMSDISDNSSSDSSNSDNLTPQKPMRILRAAFSDLAMFFKAV